MTARAARAAYRRWWDAPDRPRAARVAFRAAFFAVLGVDAFLALPQAARYGHGFNVSHLPWLDGVLPLPGRAIVLALTALAAALALRVAFGGGRRGAIALLAGLFGATYFWSQLDSYQHHYLVVLFLVVLAARPGRLADEGPGWPLRLLLVQASVVYLWAVVAKLDPLWTSGLLLDRQLHGEAARALVLRTGGFGAAALAVIAVEGFLAVAIHVRRLRPIAAPLGVAFHAAIQLLDFRIGLFSYFMIAVYLLVLPDGWLPAIAARLARLADRLPRPTVARAPSSALGVAALVGGTAALAALPFREVAWPVAGIAGALAAAAWWRARAAGRGAWQVAVGHLAAGALLALLGRTTDVALDHYRFLGGSSRRLGDLDGAAAAYRRAVELATDDARVWVGLARSHALAGRADAARAAAARALELEPDNRNARALQGGAGDATAESTGDPP